MTLVGVILTSGYFYVHRPVEIVNPPVILGHGGMGMRSTLPLNSKASIERALAFPIAGTELDVKMTADGVLVAFHDDDLVRNTNCTGSIADHSFAELSACTNSTWLKDEPIASLHSVLDLGWPEETIFSLDLKPDRSVRPEIDKYLNAVVETVRTYPRYKFLIESGDIQVLVSAKRKDSSIKTFLYTVNVKENLSDLVEYKIDGVSIDINHVSQEEIETLRANNLSVMIWGSGSVFSNRKALKLQPDYIQTDDVKSMARLLNLK
jgi:glycerophosphoryl diester phosphodiesterase